MYNTSVFRICQPPVWIEVVCPEDPCIIDDTPQSCPALCSDIFERFLSHQETLRHYQPGALI